MTGEKHWNILLGSGTNTSVLFYSCDGYCPDIKYDWDCKDKATIAKGFSRVPWVASGKFLILRDGLGGVMSCSKTHGSDRV